MSNRAVVNSVPKVKVAPPSSLTGVLAYLPGILLLAVVGYAGKLIEHSIAVYGKTHHVVLPNIE
jgi:hypothetical protein